MDGFLADFYGSMVQFQQEGPMNPIDKKERTTLGVLLSDLDGSYQELYFRGVVDEARKHDADVVFYASRDKMSAVYHLASPSRIDGLLIDCSSFFDRSSLQDYLARSLESAPLPLIITSEVFADVPSVRVDQDAALDAVVRHLHVDHGCRKIAFVTGPQDLLVTQERMRVWRETLGSLGLTIGNDLVFEGDFIESAGREAVLHWFSGTPTKGRPDAVVFANDEMALGGLAAFRTLNIAVPEEVRVSGYDDMLWARVSTPTLTTVYQPIYEKAQAGVRLLLDRIAGKRVPYKTLLPAHAIFRESCCGTSAAPSDGGERWGNLALNERALTKLSLSFIERLSLATTLDKLVQELGTILDQVGVSAGVLLQPTGRAPGQSRFLRLAGDALVGANPSWEKTVDTRMLVPDWLWKKVPETLVVLTLEATPQPEPSFLVLGGDNLEPAVFMVLRDRLAAALRTVEAFQSLDTIQRRLDRSLAGEDLVSVVLVETDLAGRVLFQTGEARFPDELTLEADPVWRRALEGVAAGKAPVLVESGEFCFRAKQMGHRILWAGFPLRRFVRQVLTPDEALIRQYALTARETEVCALLLQGMTPMEIGEEIRIGYTTVKSYTASLYYKLGVHSRGELAKKVGISLLSGGS